MPPQVLGAKPASGTFVFSGPEGESGATRRRRGTRGGASVPAKLRVDPGLLCAPGMKTPRVLIADDESSVANSFGRQFRAAGWEVEVTTIASAVLELAERSPPNLVILDVQQGAVSGIDVLRGLKANPTTQAIPVVMITGEATPETRAAGMDAGALGFMSKPMARENISTLRQLVDAKPPGPSVLISDDDQGVIRVFERGARREGLTPIAESDATRIVDLAERTEPAVIVLDINQTHLDGRDVLATLKANPRTRDIPVVMVSGIEDQQTRHDCFMLGADDYVVKPIDALFFTRLARRAHA